MSIIPKDFFNCPFLILAPMEGVGDRCFRKAIATIGGFDEAVREFLRVPRNAHIPSLAIEYDPQEMSPIPMAAQLMGSDPELMAKMAIEIESRGAKRIDLNCGCPSNTVTGKGAGSSLLKDPNFVHEVAKAMVRAVSVPVTIKMRSGFEDISLFKENLIAAQESGVRYVTLHPRTKVDGYGPPARWDLIAEAKSLLKIPVVGNGDILNLQDALRMLKETGCDALMIGRGSLINPFIFHQIRAHFSQKPFQASLTALKHYIMTYYGGVDSRAPNRTKVSKLKQLLGFIFKGNAQLQELRNNMLTSREEDPEAFLSFALGLLEKGSELGALNQEAID